MARRSFGEFGDRTQTATATPFFAWFHLEPDRGADMPAGTTRYRPSGPTFHDVARLDVGIDQGGLIDRMTLDLRRTFIDNARDGVFAGDIAASFIENVGGPSDRALVQPFLDAVKRDALDRPGVIVRAGTLPEPSSLDEAERPLLVYRGGAGSYAFTLPGVVISLQNVEDDGVPSLRIVAYPAERAT